MPRTRLTRRFAIALALPLALAATAFGLAACTAQPSASLPDGLSVRVQQGRLDIEAQRLVVRLENDGDEPVTVERLEVVAPTLTPGMVRDEPFEVAPGNALQIRLPLSASECGTDAGSETPAPEATILLQVATTSGRASSELIADDPHGTLARIANSECLAESVDRVAALQMPEHLRSTGSGIARRAFIDVDIVPEASGDGSFTIDRVYGTTLLNAEDGVDWPLGTQVAAGGDPVTISLPVRPARCDAHAIADDKRGTILPFEIRTSDGREGRLDRSSGDTLKAELYAYYGERCALQ
ncbi:hypothetical protein DCE93_04210 [Agromyces badenianii]|uniref:DUF4232 domain-containing protein n=1 Tax=Agromyces badenianii TaxID=2080742 RepID=A0A2S0WUJ0_9MICO|nr:hypothetical protein [Agromyces badenianii]AWB94961.1 hypothetical protein DCE93_04210 [Agromyces badenianii]